MTSFCAAKKKNPGGSPTKVKGRVRFTRTGSDTGSHFISVIPRDLQPLAQIVHALDAPAAVMQTSLTSSDTLVSNTLTPRPESVMSLP